MTHLAHSLKSNVVEHIRDNGAYSILPGLDLSDNLHLDSLTFSMGILGSYDGSVELMFNIQWGYSANSKHNSKDSVYMERFIPVRNK